MNNEVIVKQSRLKVAIWTVIIIAMLGYLCSMFFYSSVKKPAIVFSIAVCTILLFFEIRMLISPKILVKLDKTGVYNTTTFDFKGVEWNEIKDIYIYKEHLFFFEDLIIGNYICFTLRDKKGKKPDVSFNKKHKNKGDMRIPIVNTPKKVDQIFAIIKDYYKSEIEK